MKEEMVVTITLLNDFGMHILVYNRCLMDLVVVIDYIYKFNGIAKRYMFSKLAEESVGGTFCSISNTQQY